MEATLPRMKKQMQGLVSPFQRQLPRLFLKEIGKQLAKVIREVSDGRHLNRLVWPFFAMFLSRLFPLWRRAVFDKVWVYPHPLAELPPAAAQFFIDTSKKSWRGRPVQSDTGRGEGPTQTLTLLKAIFTQNRIATDTRVPVAKEISPPTPTAAGQGTTAA